MTACMCARLDGHKDTTLIHVHTLKDAVTADTHTHTHTHTWRDTGGRLHAQRHACTPVVVVVVTPRTLLLPRCCALLVVFPATFSPAVGPRRSRSGMFKQSRYIEPQRTTDLLRGRAKRSTAAGGNSSAMHACVSVCDNRRTHMTQIGQAMYCNAIHSHDLVSCVNTHTPRCAGTQANYALAIQASHRPYERSW
jgi:hypothetical protein